MMKTVFSLHFYEISEGTHEFYVDNYKFGISTVNRLSNNLSFYNKRFQFDIIV